MVRSGKKYSTLQIIAFETLSEVRAPLFENVGWHTLGLRAGTAGVLVCF